MTGAEMHRQLEMIKEQVHKIAFEKHNRAARGTYCIRLLSELSGTERQPRCETSSGSSLCSAWKGVPPVFSSIYSRNPLRDPAHGQAHHILSAC